MELVKLLLFWGGGLQFSCDVFLSHRIPAFLHQTPVVRATACWTPAAIGSGTSKQTDPLRP